MYLVLLVPEVMYLVLLVPEVMYLVLLVPEVMVESVPCGELAALVNEHG